MARKGRRAPLLDEVEKQIASRTGGPIDQLTSAQESLSYLSWLAEMNKQIASRIGGPIGQLKSAQEMLTYLSWLAWHCRKFAAVPSFLDAARADIVAILYAGAAGLERSAYLHARSLLENLVRHCYFDSRPALFAGLRTVYARSSRFVHGSTVRYRSDYEGIGSITIDEPRTRDLGGFLQDVGELGLLLLSMFHLGPYLLISQPLRRYMLLKMRSDARTLFLLCMKQVSLPWAKHQRSAALRTLHERKSMPIPSRDGILNE